METALHEALHWSRSNFGARKVLGAFWEEGLTEHLMQLMTGPRPTAYRDNIAFVGEVEAIVGRRVLQDAYLHGVWDRLTTRLEQHFGRPETVERFLETIRRVGPRGENPAALARARAMLRAGSGGGVPGPAAPTQGGSGGGP